MRLRSCTAALTLVSVSLATAGLARRAAAVCTAADNPRNNTHVSSSGRGPRCRGFGGKATGSPASPQRIVHRLDDHRNVHLAAER
jgi:hypothetical protein